MFSLLMETVRCWSICSDVYFIKLACLYS